MRCISCIINTEFIHLLFRAPKLPNASTVLDRDIYFLKYLLASCQLRRSPERPLLMKMLALGEGVGVMGGVARERKEDREPSTLAPLLHSLVPLCQRSLISFLPPLSPVYLFMPRPSFLSRPKLHRQRAHRHRKRCSFPSSQASTYLKRLSSWVFPFVPFFSSSFFSCFLPCSWPKDLTFQPILPLLCYAADVNCSRAFYYSSTGSSTHLRFLFLHYSNKSELPVAASTELS